MIFSQSKMNSGLAVNVMHLPLENTGTMLWPLDIRFSFFFWLHLSFIIFFFFGGGSFKNKKMKLEINFANDYDTG